MAAQLTSFTKSLLKTPISITNLIDGVEVGITVELVEKVVEDDDVQTLGIQLVLHDGDVFRRLANQIQRFEEIF